MHLALHASWAVELLRFLVTSAAARSADRLPRLHSYGYKAKSIFRVVCYSHDSLISIGQAVCAKGSSRSVIFCVGTPDIIQDGSTKVNLSSFSLMFQSRKINYRNVGTLEKISVH